MYTILTEKESVAKNYAKAMNLKKKEKGLYESEDGKIKLTYAAGHLYKSYDAEDYDEKYKAWKKEDLPIIPKKYLYKADPKKAAFRRECEKHLRNAVKEGDEIIIATDPDREGEVIARLILNALKVPKERITRVWACEGLASEEILKGLSERKSDGEYDDLALRGLTQKECDWLMGINLSRSYTIILGDLFSVGRVQTAILKEIYQRHAEIELFLKVPYYILKVTFEDGSTGHVLAGNGKETFRREEAEKVLKKIEGKKAECTEMKESEEKESAPKLYELSLLERDAFTIYGFPIDETERMAQELYNERGVLSYPRTSSRYLKAADAEKTRELYGRLSESDGRFNTEKERINEGNKRVFGKTEGHHAIIPSSWMKEDGTDEWKVYDLVLRRFLMQGMKDYEWLDQKAELRAGEEIIRAEGKKIREKGWKEADLHEEKKFSELRLKKGERYGFKAEIVEKMTEPPPYHTEASVLAFMRNPEGKDEETGERLSSIGTEATQASIIKVLYKRGYIKKVRKHIEITDKGIKLVEKIKGNKVIDRNTSVESTTRWERMNEDDPVEFKREMEEAVRKSVEALKKEMDIVMEKKKIGKCPACGGEILKGKNSYYCSNWKEKECTNSLVYHLMGNEMTDDRIRELLEKKELPLMEGTTKKGEKVKFNVKEVEGKWTIVFMGESDPVCSCPKCGKKVFKYRKVYKCSSEVCDFFLWRETSGVTYTEKMVRDLSEGKKVRTVMIKKDGSEADVEIELDRDEWKLHLYYL